MGEHQQHRALPLGRQRRPQGCTRLTGLAHGVTPATEPAPGALPDRFSVICRSPSNYQRQHVWDIEQLFRSAKSLLETRPIFHQRDETIRGHVFCSFLALILRKELEDRLSDQGLKFEWADVLRDVDRLQDIEIEQDGKRFCLRTPVTGVAGKVFQAVGIALPPNIRDLGPAAARASPSKP